MTAADRRIQRALVVVGALAALALAGFLVYRFFLASDDEPPIRVKNGSLELELCDGSHWASQADRWEPPKGRNNGGFWVTFAAASGHRCATLMATGKQVQIYYSTSPNTPQVLMLPHYRTRVQPKPNVSPKTGQGEILTSGQPGDTAYISKVEVLGGAQPETCSFNSDAELTYVDISTNGAYRTCDDD